MRVHRYLWRARAEPCKVALYLLAHFFFFSKFIRLFPKLPSCLVAFRPVFVMTDNDDDSNNNSIQVFAVIVLIQHLQGQFIETAQGHKTMHTHETHGKQSKSK